MPTLTDALRGRDLGFLKMVANAWGLEFSAPDTATALPQLVEGILGHQWRDDVLETLPRDAQAALQSLLKSEGRLSWALFTRRFGEVRPFGPGKREKERPDLKPISPAEMLWYRALIGRAFLPGDEPPMEYAYIPDDLLDLLAPLGQGGDAPPGRPATPTETAHPRPANDRILDHACTLLAGCAWGCRWPAWTPPVGPCSAALLLELLKAARLVDDTGQPLAEPVRTFLEAPRGAGAGAAGQRVDAGPVSQRAAPAARAEIRGRLAQRSRCAPARPCCAGSGKVPAGAAGGAWPPSSAPSASATPISSARPAITTPGSSAPRAAANSCAALSTGMRSTARCCASSSAGRCTGWAFSTWPRPTPSAETHRLPPLGLG